MRVKCQCTHEVTDSGDVMYGKYGLPCSVQGESRERVGVWTTFHFENCSIFYIGQKSMKQLAFILHEHLSSILEKYVMVVRPDLQCYIFTNRFIFRGICYDISTLCMPKSLPDHWKQVAQEACCFLPFRLFWLSTCTVNGGTYLRACCMSC